MSDDNKAGPPDRLSNNPASDHFDLEAMQRGVGVRFKDRERSDVEEYCASEGWIRVQAGKAVDRNGYPVTVKLTGPVEIWWRDEGGSDIAPHQHENQQHGHGPTDRKGGPAGHGSNAPPPQIRKKQDRSS